MTPIDQTIFGGDNHDPMKRGNCMQASFASLLDLPLDQVPHFVSFGDDWRRVVDEWLAERGMWYLPVAVELLGGACWPRQLNTLCLLSGDSPRGNFSHMVVGRIRMDAGEWLAELVHDPHPSRLGLAKVTFWDFILPLNPAAALKAA